METERRGDPRPSIAAEQPPHNLLLDVLPETVVVNGRTFVIESGFRTGILFEMMATDTSLSNADIASQALLLYYRDDVPEDIEAAYEAIVWFYRCGYEERPKRRRRGKAEAEEPQEHDRIFDYDEDGPLIYAAFKSQYQIDLQDTDMHWWKFNALFQGLHECERICEIMGYRSLDLSEIKDKDTRVRYAKLKEKYALPDGLSVDQKIARAGLAFAGGM